jgi:hypothetical protein
MGYLLIFPDFSKTTAFSITLPAGFIGDGGVKH